MAVIGSGALALETSEAWILFASLSGLGTAQAVPLCEKRFNSTLTLASFIGVSFNCWRKVWIHTQVIRLPANCSSNACCDITLAVKWQLLQASLMGFSVTLNA
ncbi:hypothetical protein WJX82_007203 [Trebouxia sp. C0006]